jgi:cell division protein FtsQ
MGKMVKKIKKGEPDSRTRRFLKGVKWLGLSISLLFLIGIGLPRGIRRADSLFTVKRIMVTGNRYHSLGEILDAAGFTVSRSIFSADLKEAVRRVEKLPNVKNVEIQRIFPDIIGINVVEYRPVAVLNGDRPVLMDNEGTILELDLRSAKIDLPVLTGMYVQGKLCRERFKKAQTILQVIGKRNFPVKISEINLSYGDNITLYPDVVPIRILLGGGELEEQLEKLIIAWDRLESRVKPLACLDLRFRRQIVLKPSVSTKEIVTAKNQRL